MILNEEQIIEGCKRKKRRARKELYQQYHKLMLGICLRYSTSTDEAEDVMLIGFMNIMKKIDSFSKKGSFVGWMKRIMVNTAIDNYRKNKKHYSNSDITDFEEEPSLSVEFRDNLSTKDILAMVQNLPQGYKIVFNLFAIEGYSHLEIAEMLNVSVNTSKTQLFMARKILQRELEKQKA